MTARNVIFMSSCNEDTTGLDKVAGAFSYYM